MKHEVSVQTSPSDPVAKATRQYSTLHQTMAAAQQLAFAPVSFMTAYCMKRMGIFDHLHEALGEGLDVQQLADRTGISTYAVLLLVESGLAIGALTRIKDRFYLTKLGHVLRNDAMTDANFEFIYQVCYRGLFHLEDSLRKGQPRGLQTISDAPTVYEGLHQLASPVKKAWLEFDHFYSDSAFDEALPYVFAGGLNRLLDVGGNTGRFTRACLDFDSRVEVTICDLPQQIAMAKDQLASDLDGGRLHFHACDLLSESATLPPDFDAVWMSQFLVCFDEATVLRILRLVHGALHSEGRLMILDTFWDRQTDPVARFCLIQTSPYFTAIANGNSKIHRSDTIQAWAESSGFTLERVIDGLGVSHSLMIFARQ
jgi:hypothetical protein